MCGIWCSAHVDSDQAASGSTDEHQWTMEALGRRGPDASGVKSWTVGRATLTLKGWVLALRGAGEGRDPVRQPLTDTYGNILVFNGEVFGGIDIGRDENDTQQVLEALSKTTNEVGVRGVIDTIQGPYAFVYWQTATRKLFFGRDPLGRRSLLQRCTLTENTNSAASVMSSITLSSVSDGSEKIWTEVSTETMFFLDFANDDGILVVQALNRGRSIMRTVNKRIPSDEELLPVNSMSRLSEIDPECIPDHHHASQKLHSILNDASRARIESIPPSVQQNNARLGILFSGGLDCTALACLAHLHVPLHEPIDLLNVAFENPRTLKRGIVGPQVFDVPDRLTGIKALRALQASFPRRTWKFVSVNVTQKEYLEAKDRVIRLMSPSGTVMDLSIAIALWFASRGRGHLMDGQEESYTSTAKVLLSGLGADEQLGGYGRHAACFNTSRWSGLCEELQLDIYRLPHRNLGRDDRVISDHGKEVRFPFLDEHVLDFVSSLPVHYKADLRLPRGLGDKFLLRWMLHSMYPGMASVAMEPKRAIQFGARTAKIEGNDKGDCLLTQTCS